MSPAGASGGSGAGDGRADRAAALWLAYVKLGGNLTRERFARRLTSPGGLDGRDLVIVEQVLFEESL